MEGWCEKGGIKDYKILEEKLTSGRISQSQLGKLYLPGKSTEDFITNLEITAGIIRKIKAERSTEALDRAKAAGKRLGRPAGQKKAAEKNVLYGKTDRLVSLNSEGLSPAKIALQLGVSRGTVANYIKAKGLER